VSFLTLQTLEEAVSDRLVASFAANPSVGASVINSLSSENSLPAEDGGLRVVFNIVMDQATDVESFTGDAKTYTIEVTAYGNRDDGGSALTTALRRIHGNFDPSAQTVGNYGLEFWEPSISGVGSNKVRFVTASTQHDERVLSYIMTFEVVLTRE